MPIASPQQLMQRIHALPAAGPLLDAAADGVADGVYLVGGCVRDLLLGADPVDIDVCVEGPIEPLLARLPGTVVNHGRFATATVAAAEARYDVARAREESYPRGGALPRVQPSDIVTDLHRRDFTVNAIAVALAPTRIGEIISAVDALEHLELRRLEVLHSHSFIDDPTRLLRLVRYAARLRFEIGANTRRLAEAAVAAAVIGTVSGPRIGNELRLMAAELDPVAAFGELSALGLDSAIHAGFGLGPEHSERAALTSEALAVLGDGGRPELLVLAACLLNVPAAEADRLLDRLGFTASERETVGRAAADSPTLSARLRTLVRPSEIAAAIGSGSPELVALAGALGARTQAWEWLQRLRGLTLAIGGEDLLAAGVPAGPRIGAGLAAARAALLDGRAPGPDEQLRIALGAARDG